MSFFFLLNSDNNVYFTNVWQLQKQLHGEYFSVNSIVRKHCDGYISIMHSGDDFIDGRLIFVTTTEWKHGHEGTNCSDGAIRIIDYICVCFTAKVFCVHTLQAYSGMQLKVNLTDIRFPLRGFTEHQMEHYWKVAINCANPGPTK